MRLRLIGPVMALAVLAVAVITPPAAAESGDTAAESRPPANPVARGRYLTRIGNCAGCHTAPGGRPLAGGRALETVIGTFRTPNITPDPDTGTGNWSRDDLWAAMHRGEKPDGRSLYPACPYPSLTRMTRADVDAIHAYLQSVPPVNREIGGHDLGFPYRYRSLLALWQAMYFEPGGLEADPARSDAWNRGRYLVEGPGHCNECHRERNFMGAVKDDVSARGGMVHGWYAPSLHDRAEAGLQRLSVTQAAAFLRTGKSPKAVMMGPMAGVVYESLRYLSPADARAMAVYLTSLPERETPQGPARGATPRLNDKLTLGERIYDERCKDCHGGDGQGDAGISALAGNPGVTLSSPRNAINMIRRGGFPASVPGHPRPHGMPPHYDLSEREVAAVATYIRRSWGNTGSVVSTIDVGGR